MQGPNYYISVKGSSECCDIYERAPSGKLICFASLVASKIRTKILLEALELHGREAVKSH